jgi:hypothetical protein
MCRRLAEVGVRAEPSYRLIAVLDRDLVARSLASGAQNGLIAARVVDVEQRVRYESTPVSGGYVGWRTWGGFYSTTLRIDEVARIETQVWSTAGEGRMIWAGASERVIPRDLPKAADKLAAQTVSTLQKSGILPTAD